MYSGPSRFDPVRGTLYNSVLGKLDPKDGRVPLNLLNCSGDEFSTLMDEFSRLFELYMNETMNTRQQLAVAWYYMAVSLYVHHWAQDVQGRLTDKDSKFERIKQLDARFAPYLAQVFRNANNARTEYYSNEPVFYHQQLLYLNNTVFHFIELLKENGNVELEQLVPALLDFNPDKLRQSKDVAQSRYQSEPSGFESAVNIRLFERLSTRSDTFKPVKQNPTQGIVIDSDTGLELDFPLRGKITIESDGKHSGHFTDETHSIVHNFKAFALREAGWIRVGVISGDTWVQKIDNISDLMSFPNTKEFVKKYEQLMQQRKTIHDKIRSILIKVNQNNSPELLAARQRMLNDFLEYDKRIRRIIEARYFERFLLAATSVVQGHIQTKLRIDYLQGELAKLRVKNPTLEIAKLLQGLPGISNDEQLTQELEKERARKLKYLNMPQHEEFVEKLEARIMLLKKKQEDIKPFDKMLTDIRNIENQIRQCNASLLPFITSCLPMPELDRGIDHSTRIEETLKQYDRSLNQPLQSRSEASTSSAVSSTQSVQKRPREFTPEPEGALNLSSEAEVATPKRKRMTSEENRVNDTTQRVSAVRSQPKSPELPRPLKRPENNGGRSPKKR